MKREYLDIFHSRDLATFETALLRASWSMGFGLFGTMLVQENPLNKKDAVFHIIDNTPPAHLQKSRDPASVARSPIIKRLKCLSTPFSWDQRMHVEEGAADLWEAAAPHGYKVGIAVALHLPHHRHFVFSLDRDTPLPRSQHKMARMLADLHLAAVYAEGAASRLMLPLLNGSLSKLSRREIESLKWTMEGKTAWEVGAILSISERSVVFHLKNCMRKLGAINKHQAVLKALGQGLI
jgi:DNA-binding CsgD family transcriptional regulator